MKRPRVSVRVPAPSPYLDLVRASPLVPIQNKADHKAALAVIDRMTKVESQSQSDSGLSPWEAAYLEVLGVLTRDYERRREPLPGADVDGAGVLADLMREHGLSIAALGRETGLPPSTLSEILSRRRGISRRVRAKLCARFGVGPAAFV